ncbi:MAG: Crp/Fnr family transcriptional regulator [Alphaproteobacteria bacterium]|nr:Crp/Fnr family transcriptional regulator [Alphaproteobacteria bacterium]
MTSTTEDMLANVFLFEELTSEERIKLAKKCNWYTYAAEETVFDPVNDSLEVYFVVKGAVRVFTDALYKCGDSEEITFANFTSGNYFGELSAIDGEPRSAHVVAQEETLLASMNREDFVELINEHASVAFNIAKRLASIVRSLNLRVTELSSLNDIERVYNEIVRLAIPDAKKIGGWVIPIMLKHSELAGLAGTTREIVAQVIGDLAREGIVERRSLALQINDWQRLRLMAKVD